MSCGWYFFFPTFQAKVDSRAPQNNPKHLPFDFAPPPAYPWNALEAPSQVVGSQGRC